MFRVLGPILLLIFLTSCRPAQSNPTPGIWAGQTDFGTFTFTIDSSGTHIEHFDYDMHTCSPTDRPGGRAFEGAVFFSPPIEIQAHTFSFLLSGAPGISFQGEFSETGEQATGIWKVGQCEGAWEITF